MEATHGSNHNEYHFEHLYLQYTCMDFVLLKFTGREIQFYNSLEKTSSGEKWRLRGEKRPRRHEGNSKFGAISPKSRRAEYTRLYLHMGKCAIRSSPRYRAKPAATSRHA